jgi:MFS family permease
VFFSFGAALGTWAGAVPQITRNANVDDMALGLGLTAYTGAYVLAMALGPRLARYTTNRAILMTMLPLLGLCVVGLASSGASLFFFAALIMFGALLGLTDLFMNAEASAIETELARPVFASFHGSASAGVAVFAILGSLVATWTAPWVAGILTAMLLLTSAEAVRRWLTARRPALVTHPLSDSGPIDLIPFSLLGLAAGLVIAGETAAIMWSAKLLDQQAAALAAIAGIGVAFFGLCHAAVRFLGDRSRARFGDMPLMLGSLAVAAAGFTAIGLSGNFVMSVAAFAVVGFGTACVIPCIFALAARLTAANRARGIGFISLIAGLPRIGAPWLFGWLAEIRSTSFAFAMCAVAMLVALVFIALIRKLVEQAPNSPS